MCKNITLMKMLDFNKLYVTKSDFLIDVNMLDHVFYTNNSCIRQVYFQLHHCDSTTRSYPQPLPLLFSAAWRWRLWVTTLNRMVPDFVHRLCCMPFVA